MPNNTDAQRRRRADAIAGTLLQAGLRLVLAAVLLVWRHLALEGLAAAVILFIALADLGTVVLMLILLKTRLKEIEGGEEDAAAQY